MNPELFEELRRLRNEIAHETTPLAPSAVAARLESLGASISAEQLPHLIPTILQIFGHRGAGRSHVPAIVRDTIRRLLEDRSAKTVCDPWAGLGDVLAVAQNATSAERSIALNANASEAQLGRALFPSADWRVGAPLSELKNLEEPIDVAVSILPFGVKTNESIELANTEGQAVELRDDLGHLVLAEATAHLVEQGIGLFVVPPSFFVSRRSVLRHFSELGFGIEAAFAIPSGAFAPYTSIATYLVVVSRSAVATTFVAQLSNDENTNAQIVANFRNGQEGGSVDLGRYVNILEFRGLDALRAADYFARAEEQLGVPAVALQELATGFNLGRHGSEFEFQQAKNAIYVPMIGLSDVVDSVQYLTLKKQNYAQVLVDPMKSQARFVAKFLNSELGKRIRDWAKSGTTIPKLNKQGLQTLQVLVPDLATQRGMLEIEARLSTEANTLRSLQNELAELRRELWRRPRSADDVSDRIDELSMRISGDLKDQARASLDHWFETIPFPMASILRAWQATPSNDPKTKYEHLLHFFEATAEFLSLVLLSAFSSNEQLYEPHREKLLESFNKQNLSFEKATFGTWRLVVDYLTKQTRKLLQEGGRESEGSKNDREICAAIFADGTLRLPTLLSNKGIGSVLSATNKMRNDWSGHGGVVGEEEAKRRNELLLEQLEKLREAMSDVWEITTLVSASYCVPSKGSFANEVAVLKGSNSEFLKRSRTMSTWLDVDSLYLVSEDQGSALKLLPLVRLGPSPESAKNACYFFNRTEGDGARFVSYHFVNEPELSGRFEDAIEAIKLLTEP
jgi:hypothetical protein